MVGGTPSRIGMSLVPMPVDEEMAAPFNHQTLCISLSKGRGDDRRANQRKADLTAVGVAGEGQGDLAREPGNRSGLWVTSSTGAPGGLPRRARAEVMSASPEGAHSGHPHPHSAS